MTSARPTNVMDAIGHLVDVGVDGGLVAIEVFGHLSWALPDVETLFEAELSRLVGELTDGG